ncbi:hypothetical protein C7S16_5548 [Burkholderia thailandensis]|uniref:Uncharacterized protein n=1 Tax=Burkholderia thailandensis TaxID=57975 RepID=A0AAW9CRD9_BURTH|nr:hypothetical protein [Burkholderia thailandensis]MDW9251643.1 hypothetical protein [Burkholderia thailandensis]
MGARCSARRRRRELSAGRVPRERRLCEPPPRIAARTRFAPFRPRLSRRSHSTAPTPKPARTLSPPFALHPQGIRPD